MPASIAETNHHLCIATHSRSQCVSGLSGGCPDLQQQQQLQQGPSFQQVRTVKQEQQQELKHSPGQTHLHSCGLNRSSARANQPGMQLEPGKLHSGRTHTSHRRTDPRSQPLQTTGIPLLFTFMLGPFPYLAWATTALQLAPSIHHNCQHANRAILQAVLQAHLAKNIMWSP